MIDIPDHLKFENSLLPDTPLLRAVYDIVLHTEANNPDDLGAMIADGLSAMFFDSNRSEFSLRLLETKMQMKAAAAMTAAATRHSCRTRNSGWTASETRRRWSSAGSSDRRRSSRAPRTSRTSARRPGARRCASPPSRRSAASRSERRVLYHGTMAA